MPSLHVKGVQVADEAYEQMKAVYDACKKANVAVPDQVMEFFGWDEPSPFGQVVDLDLSDAVAEYQDMQGREGFQVQLDRLPKNITHLRFYVSW